MFNNKAWRCAAFLLAAFPLAPTISDSGDHRYVVVISQILMAIIFQRSFGEKLASGRLLSLNLWMAMMVQTVICVSDLLSISPPTGCIYISWLCFMLSWLAPFCENKSAKDRFFAISTATFIIYSLLSTFYEGLFFITLIVALYLWINVENTKSVTRIYYILKTKMFDRLKESFSKKMSHSYIRMWESWA